MKFVYVDETGDKGQSDVFVMTGLLIDAYSLRKYTATFDDMITTFLARHPNSPTELKTQAIINGSKGWRKVDAAERKEFISKVCDLAAKCATIYAVAFSFQEFDDTARKAGYDQPFGNSYWLGAAMFIAALVQKQMKTLPKNKGLTVFICDDNKWEMSNLSDALYKADPWFDPIYQTSKKKEVPADRRFDQIINSAFAIKSEHSSLVQVADAVSYAYRRHLELKSNNENWSGEGQYFASLVAKLKKEPLGRTTGGQCIEFYRAVRHKDWTL
jgi:Protein of unknown function (DUF3800)